MRSQKDSIVVFYWISFSIRKMVVRPLLCPNSYTLRLNATENSVVSEKSPSCISCLKKKKTKIINPKVPKKTLKIWPWSRSYDQRIIILIVQIRTVQYYSNLPEKDPPQPSILSKKGSFSRIFPFPRAVSSRSNISVKKQESTLWSKSQWKITILQSFA